MGGEVVASSKAGRGGGVGKRRIAQHAKSSAPNNARASSCARCGVPRNYPNFHGSLGKMSGMSGWLSANVRIFLQ